MFLKDKLISLKTNIYTLTSIFKFSCLEDLDLDLGLISKYYNPNFKEKLKKNLLKYSLLSLLVY